MERKLNLDIAGAVSEFEAYMREFLVKKIIYKIIFRGKGLEFDSYREFYPDDDAKDIDWKASTKANKLLVKQYVEERDLNIMFVIDISDNMLFGSTEKLKCEYTAELSAALAQVIMNYGDKIGFVLFSDEAIKTLMPKRSKKQFDIFVDDLSNASLYGGVSEISKTLDFLLEYLDDSINAVILISDFIRLGKDDSKALTFFSNRFETIAIMVKDPLDKTLPDIKGEVIIEDPATKKQLIIDPKVVKKVYEKNTLEQENLVKKIFIDADIDLLSLTTDKSFAPYLAQFLKERIEKRKFIVPKK